MTNRLKDSHSSSRNRQNRAFLPQLQLYRQNGQRSKLCLRRSSVYGTLICDFLALLPQACLFDPSFAWLSKRTAASEASRRRSRCLAWQLGQRSKQRLRRSSERTLHKFALKLLRNLGELI